MKRTPPNRGNESLAVHGVAADVGLGSADEVLRMDEVEATISDLVKHLTPDWCGRHPFPSHVGNPVDLRINRPETATEPRNQAEPTLIAFFTAVAQQLHPETDPEGRYAGERHLPNRLAQAGCAQA